MKSSCAPHRQLATGDSAAIKPHEGHLLVSAGLAPMVDYRSIGACRGVMAFRPSRASRVLHCTPSLVSSMPDLLQPGQSLAGHGWSAVARRNMQTGVLP
jgi:hypothetical protein